jgi:STE24 endopeptidase
VGGAAADDYPHRGLIPPRLVRKAVLVVGVGAAVWVAAAVALWRSDSNPVGGSLPQVDTHRLFSAAAIDHARAYGHGATLISVGGILAALALAGLYAWVCRGVDPVEGDRAATSVLQGLLGFTLLWVVQLPFNALRLWWERRHALSRAGYLEWFFDNWFGLRGTLLVVGVMLLIVIGLAHLLGERWWLAAVPVAVAVTALFAFVTPWLVPTHRLGSPQLRAQFVALERREHVRSTRIVVQDVGSLTSVPNSFTAGFGPSTRVVVWDTLLDGRFTGRQVRVVLAHELGHVAYRDVLKSLAWSALFFFPIAYLLARFTRLRGGLGEPRAAPLLVLGLVVLGVLVAPLQNVVSRHIEADADWAALNATRDPAAQQALFQRLATTALEDPSPGLFEYVLFADHPTLAQRVAMVEAWRAQRR